MHLFTGELFKVLGYRISGKAELFATTSGKDSGIEVRKRRYQLQFFPQSFNKMMNFVPLTKQFRCSF